MIHMLFADRFKVQLLQHHHDLLYNKMLYFVTFFYLPEASTEARHTWRDTKGKWMQRESTGKFSCRFVIVLKHLKCSDSCDFISFYSLVQNSANEHFAKRKTSLLTPALTLMHLSQSHSDCQSSPQPLIKTWTILVHQLVER